MVWYNPASLVKSLYKGVRFRRARKQLREGIKQTRKHLEILSFERIVRDGMSDIDADSLLNKLKEVYD